MNSVTKAICVSLLLSVFSFGCDIGEQVGQIAEIAKQGAAAQAEAEQNAKDDAEKIAEQMKAQMQAEMAGDKPVEQAPTTVQAQGATSDGPIGVPECDEYLKKFPACVESKAPAMAKENMMMGFNATVQAWKQMAAEPGAKATLKSTCKMTLDQAKVAMKMYGCEF